MPKRRNKSRVHSTKAKKSKRTDYTSILPDEILIHIFSFLNHEELYGNVRAVCCRWYRLILTPSLWKTIRASSLVPTGVVCKWIEHSPLLRSISLIDRNDMNSVAEKLSSFSRNLESIVVENCWGTSKSRVIHGTTLCKMLRKCPKLAHFKFVNSNIRSVKFFSLIARKRSAVRADCSYSGPVNGKQLEALLASLRRNDHYYLSQFIAILWLSAVSVFVSFHKKTYIQVVELEVAFFLKMPTPREFCQVKYIFLGIKSSDSRPTSQNGNWKFVAQLSL